MSALCLERCGQRIIYLWYLLNKIFIYFFLQCENTVVTQERINMNFCTEHSVIGHLGAHWEGKRKRKFVWDFCLQWFQFYREVFGWLAQGERNLGSGRFLENKGRFIILTKKKGASKVGYESVFICLSWWKFTIALSFFHLSFPTSHGVIPPPTFLSFLITLSHEAPLPRQKNIP